MNKVLLKKQISFQIILVAIFHLCSPLKNLIDSALLELIVTLVPLWFICDVAIKIELNSETFHLFDKFAITVLIFIIHHVATKESYPQPTDAFILNLISTIISLLWLSSIPLLLFYNIAYYKSHKPKVKAENKYNPVQSLKNYENISDHSKKKIND